MIDLPIIRPEKMEQFAMFELEHKAQEIKHEQVCQIDLTKCQQNVNAVQSVFFMKRRPVSKSKRAMLALRGKPVHAPAHNSQAESQTVSQTETQTEQEKIPSDDDKDSEEDDYPAPDDWGARMEDCKINTFAVVQADYGGTCGMSITKVKKT